ncbi:MAG: hypothetical protein GVY28_05630 [Alphaproteobacteria bacterium]|jgi:membrane protein YqaA with SNARE-associated domain|nr:hypothetical protein [Alphaproteobacteria bacterium]
MTAAAKRRLESWIDRVIERAGESRGGLVGLSVLGFLENTVLPIAAEPLYMPLMTAHPRRAWVMAAALVLGCTLGALAAYLAGALLFEQAVRPLFEAAGLIDTFERYQAELRETGFSTMVVIGISPVPFQIGTVGAGVIRMDMAVFLAAVVGARSVRYFGLAALCNLVGRRAQAFIDRHRTALVVGATALGLVGLTALQVFG